MASDSTVSERPARPEARWPAVLTVLAIAALYLTFPERLTPGPNWALLLCVAILLVPGIILHATGRSKWTTALGGTLLALITFALIWSLSMLIAGLPDKREPPKELLSAAAGLWVSNVLVFACWYWRLDAGGPHVRDLRSGHTEGAFLFPQMTLPPGSKLVERNWKPAFIDYLFLAFNASTAFSPTDALVLSRWAKVLMMVQSSISLGTLAILAARAINVL